MRAQWSCGWRRCCSELPTWSTHLKSCPSLSNRFSNHRKLVSLKLYRLPHWLGEVLNPAPARRHQGKRCHERIWCLSDKKFATHLARLAGLRCRSAPYQRIEAPHKSLTTPGKAVVHPHAIFMMWRKDETHIKLS